MLLVLVGRYWQLTCMFKGRASWSSSPFIEWSLKVRFNCCRIIVDLCRVGWQRWVVHWYPMIQLSHVSILFWLLIFGLIASGQPIDAVFSEKFRNTTRVCPPLAACPDSIWRVGTCKFTPKKRSEMQRSEMVSHQKRFNGDMSRFAAWMCNTFQANVRLPSPPRMPSRVAYSLLNLQESMKNC